MIIYSLNERLQRFNRKCLGIYEPNEAHCEVIIIDQHIDTLALRDVEREQNEKCAGQFIQSAINMMCMQCVRLSLYQRN